MVSRLLVSSSILRNHHQINRKEKNHKTCEDYSPLNDHKITAQREAQKTRKGFNADRKTLREKSNRCWLWFTWFPHISAITFYCSFTLCKFQLPIAFFFGTYRSIEMKFCASGLSIRIPILLCKTENLVLGQRPKKLLTSLWKSPLIKTLNKRHSHRAGVSFCPPENRKLETEKQEIF